MPRISDLARPCVDFLSLELRQLLALDKLLGKLLGVFGMGLRRNEILQLSGAMTPESVNLLDELFEGNGHIHSRSDEMTDPPSYPRPSDGETFREPKPKVRSPTWLPTWVVAV